MSLNGFHIVFIIFSSLPALWIGAWCSRVACQPSLIKRSPRRISANMSNLALISEFLGQPLNASSHGYQIDHILEFCHWFMGALFLGWSAFFIFVLIRFRKGRQTAADHHGVRSPISTHLEFSVVLIEAVLLLGFAIPLWAKRVNQFPPGKEALVVHVVGQQFSWNFQLAGPDGQF